VFDGFIPTLLTQNERTDRLLGTTEIYEQLTGSTRICVLTLLDLYILSTQPDKGNFESFLTWRTSNLGKFPIISYDEREYWAFFNDLYIKDAKIMESFPKLIEKDMAVNYVSARFNKKRYLERLIGNAQTKK